MPEKKTPVKTRPTQASIARELGLSRTSVAEILGGSAANKYNEETCRKVEEMALKLGYRANRQARILKGEKSGLLGVIKNISFLEATEELALYSGEKIHQSGYDIISSDIFWHHDGLSKAVDFMIDSRVEGIVLASMSPRAINEPAIQRLVKSGIPLVGMGGNAVTGVTHVTADYYQGATLLAEHLVECGYRKLAIVTHEGYDTAQGKGWITAGALQGFRETALKLGVKPKELEVLVMDKGEDHSLVNQLHYKPAKVLIQQLLNRPNRPDAVVFLLDTFAIGALQACLDAGVVVPDDIAIAGFDGSVAGGYSRPTLTSLVHPNQRIAEKSVEILLDKLNGTYSGSNTIKLPCELVVRQSTGVQIKSSVKQNKNRKHIQSDV